MTNVIKQFNNITVKLSYSNISSGFIFKIKNKRETETTLKAISNKTKAQLLVSDIQSFQNVPTSNVKIVQKVQWINSMGVLDFVLEDPRGFNVSVYSSQIGHILRNCTIINGIIQEPILYHIPHKYTQVSVIVLKDNKWIDSSEKEYIV